MLDKVDHQILNLLQENSNISNATLAEQVGLKASTVYERVKKLEKKGIIKGYVALVDAEAMGKPILSFIRLGVGPAADFTVIKESVADACLQEPDVLECHALAGEDDYILRVRVANTQELEQLIQRIRSNARVAHTVTGIVLSTVKETLKLESVQES